MDYEKEYNKLKADIEKAYLFAQTNSTKAVLEHILPELAESEDEKIRKMLIDSFTRADMGGEIYGKGVTYKQVIAWLEKQVPIDEEKVLIGTRKDVALSMMDFLDKNTLGMDLSSMECADLESAVIDSDWSKVYGYMKKKLEKQGEQKENLCDKCKKEQPSHSCQDITALGRCALEKQDEQKPADWSAEDTFKVQRICKYLDEAKKYYADIIEVRDCIDWLKFLKQRIGG